MIRYRYFELSLKYISFRDHRFLRSNHFQQFKKKHLTFVIPFVVKLTIVHWKFIFSYFKIYWLSVVVDAIDLKDASIAFSIIDFISYLK